MKHARRLATLPILGGVLVAAGVCLSGCASGRQDVPAGGVAILSPRVSIQIGGSHVEPVIQTRNAVGGDQSHTLPIDHAVEAATKLDLPTP